MAQHRRARYGVAVAAVVLPCSLALVAGNAIDKDSYLTILFGATLIAGVLGGLGPGILATVLVGVVGHFVPPDYLSIAELRLLVIEGILISIVGGVLRSAMGQARERLNTNLRLEQQILEIGDDERRRIGHDLHDGLGQHLTGISLLSETMAQQMEAGKAPDPQNVETITRLVSQAVQITRDLAKSLSPVTLEQDGLIAAVEELANTSSGMFGIECTTETGDQPLPMDRTRALHLYRIIQEAVNNSVKHGKAKKVRIVVERNGKTLQVGVHDNGSGLSAKTLIDPGIGLRIMQYRARMLGASLAVERATAAGGTVVTCTCPIDGQADRS